jgi:polyisoprenoid-binding protein YceI
MNRFLRAMPARTVSPRLLTISALALTVALAVLLPGGAAGEPFLRYALRPDSSRIGIHTDSSGLFGFAGHEHEIIVTHFTGTAVIDSSDVTRIQFTIEVPADSLRVVDEDESPETRAKVARAMREDVLETQRFPTITIRGVSFAPAGDAPGHPGPPVAADLGGDLALELTLHGVTRTLAIPLDVQIDRAGLRARGKFPLRHRDYDLKRVKVAGVVNVADVVAVEFDLRGVCLGHEPGR